MGRVDISRRNALRCRVARGRVLLARCGQVRRSVGATRRRRLASLPREAIDLSARRCRVHSFGCPPQRPPVVGMCAARLSGRHICSPIARSPKPVQPCQPEPSCERAGIARCIAVVLGGRVDVGSMRGPRATRGYAEAYTRCGYTVPLDTLSLACRRIDVIAVVSRHGHRYKSGRAAQPQPAQTVDARVIELTQAAPPEHMTEARHVYILGYDSQSVKAPLHMTATHD